jgi:hypothetical protein
MTGQLIALAVAVLWFLVTRATFVDRLVALIVLIVLVCERDWATLRYALRSGALWTQSE